MGPAELAHIAAVAHKFYKQGQAQVDIAAELGVSRFKIARWLEIARTEGIVRIEIVLPGEVDAELSLAMAERYRLRRALVVRPHDESLAGIHDSIGRSAASLLAEIVTEDDVLGVTSGRTLISMAKHMRGVKACDMVQLSGLVGGLGENSVEIIRRVVGTSRGRAYVMYVPLLVRDAATASALHSDPGVRSAVAKFPEVTKAVIAVGSWVPPDSQMYSALEPEARAHLVALGARAEICATPIDERGEPIGALNDRTIAMSYEQLRRVPEVIAVAGGERKHDAIRAVLSGKFVTTLVTDASTAQHLLD